MAFNILKTFCNDLWLAKRAALLLSKLKAKIWNKLFRKIMLWLSSYRIYQKHFLDQLSDVNVRLAKVKFEKSTKFYIQF